ncbi:MAG: hypothetical protein Q4D38_06065 [Planctomycetia bacterium]|nr:hypothetical protein [Planctomycetia bacterium]
MNFRYIRSILRTLALVAALGCGTAAQARDFGADPISQERQDEIARWIEKLSDPSWLVRRNAGEKIVSYGMDAAEQLAEAAQSLDLTLAREAKFYLSLLSRGLVRATDSDEEKELLEAYERAVPSSAHGIRFVDEYSGIRRTATLERLSFLPERRGIPLLMRIICAEDDSEWGLCAAAYIFYTLPYEIPFPIYDVRIPGALSFPDKAVWDRKNEQFASERREIVGKLSQYLDEHKHIDTPGARALRFLLEKEKLVWDAKSRLDPAERASLAEQILSDVLNFFMKQINGLSNDPTLERVGPVLQAVYCGAELLWTWGYPTESQAFLRSCSAARALSLNGILYTTSEQRTLALSLRVKMISGLVGRGFWELGEEEMVSLNSQAQPADKLLAYPIFSGICLVIGREYRAVAMLGETLSTPLIRMGFEKVNLSEDEVIGMHLHAQALAALRSGKKQELRNILLEGMGKKEPYLDLLIVAYQTATLFDEEWQKLVDEKINLRLDELLDRVKKSASEGESDGFSADEMGVWVHQNHFAWLASNTHRRLDEALQMAEAATIGTAETNAAILDTLARVHAERGNFDLAIETQKKAISVRPDDPHLLKTLREFEYRQQAAGKKTDDPASEL